MSTGSSKERHQLVHEELLKLVKNKYISEKAFVTVMRAHRDYYTNLEKVEAAEHVEFQKDHKINATSQNEKQEAPVKVKKTRSPQEVRERNITWSLNLGVIMLLIGGLVLATSTWDTLGNWTKTGLIALVSLLFFGLAYVTRTILKIEKTAFAFHVLGSLFLPIIILSAGYFELFGSYFSFDGKGRYLFGAVGCLVILPVYLFLANRLASRLFIWFSYITISIFASFLIAALYLPVDGFYLGIMLFNGLLIIAYRLLKAKKRFQAFVKEFVYYIQANLILSTVLMLFIYEHELFHGFNLILTAAMYMAMVFVANQKEYHFVFSALLIYGVYQLIEFSVLDHIGAVFYALLGFVFFAVPMIIPKAVSMQKSFRYTSAVVSVIAFLYISLEGLLLRMGDPSIVLLLAYVIISMNFTFLANVSNRALFRYLSPIFFMVGLFEAVHLVQELVAYDFVNLVFFIASCLFFIWFGCLISWSFFQPVKQSTRDVASVVMFLCIYIGFSFGDFWQSGTMLLIVSIIALFIDRFETRNAFTKNAVSSWIQGISLGFSIVLFYAELHHNSVYDFIDSLPAESLVLGGIFVLLISILWRYMKWDVFYKNSFFVAQGFYAYGMLLTFSGNFDSVVRAWIILGGVGMAYLLYKKVNWIAMPYVISSLSLVFYLALIQAIHVKLDFHEEFFLYIQLVLGAFLLLGIGTTFKNMDFKLMRSFWWVGHIYLPMSLVVSLLFYGENAVWSFGIALMLYIASVHQVKVEWKLKLFLYASFTSLWIIISLTMIIFELEKQMHYGYLFTSMITAFLWLFSKGHWTKRIAYYLVPFSMLGLISFVTALPVDLELFTVTVLYGAGLLFVLHKEKWDVVNVFPLVNIYYALWLYSDLGNHTFIYVALYGVLLCVVGLMTYSTIYQKSKDKGQLFLIDWYSIIGLIAFINMYFLLENSLWTKLLPGFLIVIYLFMQRKRVARVPEKWLVFMAYIYLFQPYYAVLGHYQLPSLIERELYVLPWVLPVIYLKKILDERKRVLVGRIQWALLLMIALLLVQDGLASNTIYDALIVGGLSLISMLGGMVYQIKSFFFVGAGVLLLNLFLQTRPYWGNMPWWVYLLVAGSILIAVASYNEWHKQKTSTGKETFISKFNKKVVQKMKSWD